ncbi:MAG: amino acid ABC transporter permease [Anaerolineae bacterium]|nr:amino acid ABC transporter permease [Anaerolineae bacterium]
MEGILEFWNMIWPELGKGLLTTLQISVVALSLGLLTGIPAALARVYGPAWLRWLATAYIELFRGTPLLVQLFVIYYGLPDIARLLESMGMSGQFLVLDRMVAAYIALGLNSGAYQAEYFRSAIQAINVGQIMAARALGMSQLQAIINIVLPQSVRLAIPAWSNEVAYMVKYTSVVFIISVPDLLARGQFIISKYYNPMEILITVGIIYLIVVLGIATGMGKLEEKLRIPGLEIEAKRV